MKKEKEKKKKKKANPPQAYGCNLSGTERYGQG